MADILHGSVRTTPRVRSELQASKETTGNLARRTLLPLDDVFGCLKDGIPKLTRSSLHRCLVRHGISRLPETEDNASKLIRSSSLRCSANFSSWYSGVYD